MGLFDIFSFKKEGKSVFNRDVFKEVLETAKDAIIRMAKENIPGQEKKNQVDSLVITKILVLTTNVKNGLVLWVINRIIDLIPVVTQLVYDSLKARIEEL